MTLTGIAKGAGMIQPNMATMLAYIATDGLCNKEFLQAALHDGAEQSFNRITVDGDTSTNDSCMLTATGVSGVDLTDEAVSPQFQAALNSLMQELAHGIIRDAEGATKLLRCAWKVVLRSRIVLISRSPLPIPPDQNGVVRQ